MLGLMSIATSYMLILIIMTLYMVLQLGCGVDGKLLIMIFYRSPNSSHAKTVESICCAVRHTATLPSVV